MVRTIKTKIVLAYDPSEDAESPEIRLEIPKGVSATKFNKVYTPLIYLKTLEFKTVKREMSEETFIANSVVRD